MSAYDDAVLADGPVAYWKLEELVPGPAGPNFALTDSANSWDGWLYPTGSSTGLVQGIAGPILTDPVSYGMQGAIGRVPTSTGVNGTDLQIDDDMTWEVWFKHVSVPGPSGVAATISTFLNRGNQTTGTYLSTGQRSTGLFADQLYWQLRWNIDGSNTERNLMSCQIPRDPDIWYCGQAVRKLNEMWLYLNGWLVDYRDDCPTGPINPGTNSAWKFGYIDNAVFGAVSRSQGQSHAAIYNKGLTQALLRAHIVAALGSLPDNPCGATPTIEAGCADATGTVGVPYSSEITVTGGTAPYTFAVISGALPNGLSLNASTGAITGTPTVAGVFSFVVRVTDNDGLIGTTPGCGIVVAEEPPPPDPPKVVRTATFDGNEVGSGQRSHYWLAAQPTDSGDELRSKVVKGVRVTGKVTNASLQVYGYDVNRPINVTDVEQGENASTRPQHVPDVTHVTQSALKQVNVPNAALWTVRIQGTWEGDDSKDRIDEIVCVVARQGVRR